jgi:hypothetical protein
MNNGYTVEPMVYTDANGQEQLSYDHAVIQDHSIRRNEYNQVTGEQEGYIYEDGHGNREHAYDYGEEGAEYDEGYQTLDEYEGYEEEEEEENYSDLDEETQEAIMEAFYSEVGDQEYLDDVMLWAGVYLDDEDTEDFNDIIDNSNDPELIFRALVALCEAYEESDEEDY